MKPAAIMKICVDVVMYILFLLLMGQYLLRNAPHEWLGIAAGVLFVLHNVLNYKWYKSLFKGKYHATRLLRTALDKIHGDGKENPHEPQSPSGIMPIPSGACACPVYIRCVFVHRQTVLGGAVSSDRLSERIRRIQNLVDISCGIYCYVITVHCCIALYEENCLT